MDSIGKYEILEKIGTGGFGTVYKAYDPFIKRFVAIKTCTSDEEEVRKRFFQEAEISGNLQHRNVVTVYDFGTQNELPYLIQEFLSGEDLDRKIKRKELIPDAEKVLYLVQIARGLEYAHSKGVIHRDIKPANIRILEDGTAKIMDFGIAKLAQRSSGLTQTGMTLGTAAYLAPEQIRGEKVDQRTDIFSFGVMAYEMLVGERPFQAEAISGVLYQILNAKPKPLQTSWAGCPPDLAQVVERCLEKDPARRYANCQELLKDLDVTLRRMRVQRRPSDDMMSTAAMRSATTSAIRQVANDASQPTVATVVTPAAASGEIDLTYHRDPHQRTPRSISTTAAYREKEMHWGRWAALLVLAVAAGGGWWYYQKTQRSASTAQAASSAASSAPMNPASAAAPAPPAAENPQPPAPPAATGAADSAAPATTPPETADAAPATASQSPEPAEAKPAPPPEPEPPKPATLTVARAWSADMTVTIDGGAARRLDREQKVELKPGNHVLAFEILSQDYSDRSERQIAVKAGEKRRIEAPLGRPGQLNVQAQISSPQGLIRVKGESWGQSPIRGRKLAPGTYRIEIVPLQEAGAPAVSVDVEITSDVGTTVTFNLARPEIPPQVHQSNIGG
jgi:eukaryotic-like serine/threonine-protein kinase